MHSTCAIVKQLMIDVVSMMECHIGEVTRRRLKCKVNIPMNVIHNYYRSINSHIITNNEGYNYHRHFNF